MKISPIAAGLPARLTARINFRQLAAQKAAQKAAAISQNEARPVRPVDHAPTGRQLPDFKLAKRYQLQTVCSTPAHWPHSSTGRAIPVYVRIRRQLAA